MPETRPVPLIALLRADAHVIAELRATEFSGVDFDAFVHNTQIGPRRAAEFRQILPRHFVAPNGFTYSDGQFQRGPLMLDGAPATASLDGVLTRCRETLAPLAQHGIAVQCSGGLDSSIIAALLNLIDVPFKLIGLATSRYEFRAERAIQDAIGGLGTHSILIDYEQVLPMSALDAVPPHALPSLSSLCHAAESAMAAACNRAAVGVLMSGSGGDVLFADATGDHLHHWPLHTFADCWLDRYVYSAASVTMVYPYSDPVFADLIWRLRAGHGEDLKKRWARALFRPHLPNLLTDYTYKSDHWGIHTSGLLRGRDELVDLHARAHQLCGNDFFRESALRDLLDQDILAQDQHLHLAIEARAALAVWVCSVMADRAVTEAPAVAAVTKADLPVTDTPS